MIQLPTYNENMAYNTKETLNKSFLPFFTTLSVTYFRALLKTTKRMLRIIQLFPKTHWIMPE
mgnify:FL=1